MNNIKRVNADVPRSPTLQKTQLRRAGRGCFEVSWFRRTFCQNINGRPHAGYAQSRYTSLSHNK